MSTQLDIYQQVLALSFEMNSTSADTGTAEQLQTALAGNLGALLTNAAFAGTDSWELAWGPVVWQSPYSNVTDQAVAVCYNETQNYYVVPIAATNGHSAFDVFLEDLATTPAFMQANPTAGGGNLSYGNYVALQVLLNLASGGQTLSAYLGTTASTTSNLVFSGHSLGGGLAPLLAYALYPKGTSGSGWNNVYTFPTAGPTTADATFQAAYNAVYEPVGTSGYQRWNVNQFNGRDLVPHAWSTCSDSVGPNLNDVTASIIGQNFGMYYTNTNMAIEVEALRNMAEGLAGGGSNPYEPVNNYKLFTADQQNGQITTNALLGAEILYQHVTAYIAEFGLSTLFSAGAVESTIHPPLLSLVRGVAGTADLRAVSERRSSAA